MTQSLYFAYGSNMLHARLVARCPSAHALFAAHAPGWDIDFSKRGQDLSGKATLLRAKLPGTCAYGVVFEIADSEMPDLDRFEGRGNGYDRDDDFVVIRTATGESTLTKTYIAAPNAIDPGLKPFDWYHALVLAGARQNQLPAAHIERLRSQPFMPDPRTDRPQRLEALRVLNLSGFAIH
ncbi:MAG: gamma-glutamylcyclotransferase family protein [Hyphomicrobiaceae bacterium]